MIENMKEKLQQLQKQAEEAITGCKSEAELQNVKNGLLGKTGSLTAMLKELPGVACLMDR